MSNENDDWLIELWNLIKREEGKLSVVDTERVEEVDIVKTALEKIVIGTKVNVQSFVNSPSKSMGYVRVVGKQIIITDMSTFNQICGIASVVDVLPKTDGTVQIDFTFHGLTKRG